MLTEKKNQLHSHPSLLLLRMALIAAESDSPPCPRPDANELRAMQLIANLRAEYKSRLPIMQWGEVPSLHGFHTTHHAMMPAHV
jgi:hypothetical protein